MCLEDKGIWPLPKDGFSSSEEKMVDQMENRIKYYF